jgi:hypothetical protein
VQKGDWFALAVTILFCGLGLMLQTVSKRYLRISGAILIAAGILCLGGWGYYRADAQSPSTTGNCSPNGDHNTYNGNDCSTKNYGPPHRVNTLYDGDSELGFVDKPVVSHDKKYILFGKMEYYDGFPWEKPITFQSKSGTYLVSCPEKPVCLPNTMCATGSDNFSGQTMNIRTDNICELK